MVSDGFWHIELHLADKLTIRIHHFRIQDANHMEDDIVVTLVLIMAMNIPVARLVVNLDVPYPERAPYLNLRIKEIRAGIAVMQTWVNHFDGFAVACLQLP